MTSNNKLRVALIILAVGTISLYHIFINNACLWPVPTPRMNPKPNDSIPSPPGIIASVRGGIGNQLFIYAWAHSLAKENGWPVYVLASSSASKGRRFSPDSREFAIDQFNISQSKSFKIIRGDTFNKIPKDQLFYASDELLLNKSTSNFSLPHSKLITNSGFCHSPVYWKGYEDEVKNILKVSENSEFIKNIKSDSRLKSTIEMIEESESVAVHVRLGKDKRSWNYRVNLSPMSFYKHAVLKMVDLLKERRKKSPIFFVFSDDIDLSKKLFSKFDELSFVYVTSLKTSSIQDLYLMRKCKHILFPDSTFSWWAAYFLKKGSIVITTSFSTNLPRWWGKNKEVIQERLGTMYHPVEWIVINPLTGNFVQRDMTWV